MAKTPSQSSGSPLSALLEATRPRQWVKNLLVFAAPLFAFALGWEALARSGAAFLAFCFLSAGTYLINDLFDLEADRAHPLKKDRPLASGRLSAGWAGTAAALLLAAGLALALWLGWGTVAAAVGYLAVQAAYNAVLKHLLILDVMALASGFVVRAVAGGTATGVRISPWFLFCVALLAFYIGLQKRKGELKQTSEDGPVTRKILRSYTPRYLQEIETAVMACILMAYALWTIQAAETEWMMLSIPFVLYGILRYQHLSQSEAVERPEELLFRDKPLLWCVALWVLACFTILALDRLAGS